MQRDLITENVEAYFEMREILDSAAKRAAAAEFPFDFAKPLYLAQRTP